MNKPAVRMNNDHVTASKKRTFSNIVILVCIIGISLAFILEVVSYVALDKILLTIDKRTLKEQKMTRKPKYWVFPSHFGKKNGPLLHLHTLLQSIGYELTTNLTAWDLLWVVGPITNLTKIISDLKPHQRLNQIPGSGYITSKLSLATSNRDYIPKAFRVPLNKEIFYKYANNNRKSLFLEKNILHRGISLKNVSEIDVSSGVKFVQEYVQNPFLVDGHKFDIGVYVVITSVIPLRVYWYKGDVGFRYCPLKYYPFDPNILDKYVVKQNYMPTWASPSLAQLFSSLGHGMKDSFDIYLKSKGKDPTVLWEDVQKIIADIILIKQHRLIDALKRHRSQYNFFELIRFDLIVDINLKVYLLEANMSPNLSSTYLRANGILFEQILYNLFSITGILYKRVNRISSNKHIAVFGEQCRSICKQDCAVLELCGLCKSCRSRELRISLLEAHTEYIHRGDFRRLFPPTMSPIENLTTLLYNIPKGLSPMDRLHYMWHQGKCNLDVTWCT